MAATADDLALADRLLPQFRNVAAKDTPLSDDAHLKRFLLGALDAVGRDEQQIAERAAVMHKEALLWRQQFAVDRLKINVVHDELHTGKIIFPGLKDKLGRPVIILRPRFVVKSMVDPLQFMKSVVYLMEKAFTVMGAGVEQVFLIVDFTGANLTNVDTRLPRIALSTVQSYYPRRIGQVYVLNGPWFFKYVWAVVSRWMSPDTARRVKPGGLDGLRDFFEPDNLLQEMGGQRQFDFRDWIRDQFAVEGVDVNSIIKPSAADKKADSKDDEEPDNLVVKALEDEEVERPLKVGWMTKLGGIVKNWKRRYFILSPGLIRYYKGEAEVKPQGSIILERSRVAEAPAGTNQNHAFAIVTPLRTYVMYTDTAEERNQWMQIVQEQCNWATSR